MPPIVDSAGRNDENVFSPAIDLAPVSSAGRAALRVWPQYKSRINPD
jgi:hypothetical protein